MAFESARGASPAAPARSGGGFWVQSKRLLGRDWPVAYLFALPMVLLMFGLIAYPLLSAVWMSFHNVTGIQNRGFVGLMHYQNLWSDSSFVGSVWNTVKFATISVFFKFWIGLTAALILNRKMPLRSVFTGLILLPWIVPEVVAALTWRGLYDPIFGGINLLLIQMGLISQGIPWLGDYNLALPAVITVNVWKGIPFFTIILLSGLKAIDQELYDAAAVDGANGWQRFLNITLPGLRYVIIVACMLSLIWTLNAFGLIYLMTGGGPGGATRLFSILAYEYAIGSLRYSAGVAVAMALVPALLVMIIILGRYMRGGQRDATPSTGVMATLGHYIALPFVLVFRALGLVLGAVAAAIEKVLGGIGGALSSAYIRGDSQRETTYLRMMRRFGAFGAYVILAMLLFFELFPFYWVIITAFKGDDQMRSFRSIFWPDPWTTEHFAFMLTQTSFPTWFSNTIQVALVSMIISVSVSAFGAYAMVRLRWRGAGFLQTAIMFAYLMPTVMLFIPLYQIFTNLKLVNTLGALMLAYPTFGLPFACWLLMGYYRSIPEELEEAALIDGCNHFQAFWKIILPLTMPALLTVALFAITAAWNEFLFAFVFVTQESMRTLPVGLGMMVIGDVFPFGKMFAASIMTAIPVTIIYMMAQRFMVEGLTAGSVKG